MPRTPKMEPMLPVLQEKHLIWMFQTMVEAYSEKLKEAEHELVRQMTLLGIDLPYLDGGRVEKTREQKLENAKQCVAQNHVLLASAKAIVSHLQENTHLFDNITGDVFQLMKVLVKDTK